MNATQPIENDLSEDENPLAETPTARDLAKQFVHPTYSFKGQDLEPYTAGTDLLFNQVLDRNDKPMTLILSFIFVQLSSHYQNDDRGEREPTDEFFEQCWDNTKYKRAFYRWTNSLGTLSNQEKSEATALFEDMRGWAQKSSVEVVPDINQKKTKASRPRKSLS